MKKAETKIDFENTTVTMFGETQDVFLTKWGHYAIPLNKNRKTLKQIKSEGAFKMNLMTDETMEKKKMAQKLHSQLAHPPKNKLLQLIDRAGLGYDEELVEQINQVQRVC